MKARASTPKARRFVKAPKPKTLAIKVDEYASLCLQIKELQRKMRPLQKELKEAINQSLEGNLYVLTKKVTVKEMLDSKKIKKTMPQEWIDENTMIVNAVELVISEK